MTTLYDDLDVLGIKDFAVVNSPGSDYCYLKMNQGIAKYGPFMEDYLNIFHHTAPHLLFCPSVVDQTFVDSFSYRLDSSGTTLCINKEWYFASPDHYDADDIMFFRYKMAVDLMDQIHVLKSESDYIGTFVYGEYKFVFFDKSIFGSDIISGLPPGLTKSAEYLRNVADIPDSRLGGPEAPYLLYKHMKGKCNEEERKLLFSEGYDSSSKCSSALDYFGEEWNSAIADPGYSPTYLKLR